MKIKAHKLSKTEVQPIKPLKHSAIKKGQKFIIKSDFLFGKIGEFKKDDVVEYIGDRRSTSGMLAIFTNQNGMMLKTYKLFVDKFLNNYTNPL